jgi:hypothetical protein
MLAERKPLVRSPELDRSKGRGQARGTSWTSRLRVGRKTESRPVRFEVLMVVITKTVAFWNLTSCRTSTVMVDMADISETSEHIYQATRSKSYRTAICNYVLKPNKVARWVI